jgi:two-component system, NarL family, response regulator NreC
MTGSALSQHPLTVALADDHPVVRAGLKTLLEADSAVQVVGEFEDLPGTRNGVPVLRPDVLVLDLAMAGESSLGAIPVLLGATPGLKIVILTMQEDPGFAREALRLGASGYVLKDAAADELLLALRTVRRGSTYLHPALGAQMAVLDASTSPLTDREIQVLRLLAEGHTNAEIAARLYLSLRTVETHRGQLRTKLGLETRAELSAYAREHGLVH